MKAFKVLTMLCLAGFSFETGGCTCTGGDGEASACDYGAQQVFFQPVYAQQFLPVVQLQAYSQPVVFQQYGAQQVFFQQPVQRVFVRQRAVIFNQRRGLVGGVLDGVFGSVRARAFAPRARLRLRVF